MVTQESLSNFAESNNDADGTIGKSVSHADATSDLDLALRYDKQYTATTLGQIMFLR